MENYKLCRLDKIALGRFVVKIDDPLEEFHDPKYETKPEPSSVDLYQYSQARSESQETTLGARLMETLSSEFSNLAKTDILVQSSQMRGYRLPNSREWFKKAVQLPDTRAWLEDALVESRCDVYFIVGYSTIKDATVYSQSGKHRKQDCTLVLPTLGGIADPGANFRHTDCNGSSERFETGEQELVCSWKARKLKFGLSSSKNPDKARLGDSCDWPRRRVPRGQGSDKDMLTVYLEEEEEAE